MYGQRRMHGRMGPEQVCRLSFAHHAAENVNRSEGAGSKQASKHPSSLGRSATEWQLGAAGSLHPAG